MKDIERLLRDAPLAEVPDRLDNGVRRLIQTAELERSQSRRTWRFGLVGWVAASSLCGLLVGFVVRPMLDSPPEFSEVPAAGYVTEPSAGLVKLVGGGDPRDAGDFFTRRRTEVQTLYLVECSARNMFSEMNMPAGLESEGAPNVGGNPGARSKGGST